MKSEALDKFIGEMTTILKSSTDFVISQAPEVLRQVLMWKTAENAFDLVVSIVMIVAACVVYRKARAYITTEIAASKVKDSYYKKSWDDFPHIIVPGTLVAGILLTFGCVGIYLSTSDLIKIRVAPKVFLIEYFAKLGQERNS